MSCRMLDGHAPPSALVTGPYIYLARFLPKFPRFPLALSIRSLDTEKTMLIYSLSVFHTLSPCQAREYQVFLWIAAAAIGESRILRCQGLQAWYNLTLSVMETITVQQYTVNKRIQPGTLK